MHVWEHSIRTEKSWIWRGKKPTYYLHVNFIVGQKTFAVDK